MKPFSECQFAVVGATGNVGSVLLTLLAQRQIPPSQVMAIASSAGRQIPYADTLLPVHALENFSFQGIDFAFFAPGSEVSKIYAPQAAAQGCVVIDKTSYFRQHPDVPLVIPEVNGHLLEQREQQRQRPSLISVPNCSTIQLLMAMAPLHRAVPIRRIIACTYQSVSGAGKSKVEALMTQTTEALHGLGSGMGNASFSESPSSTIAFNVLPHIDSFMDTGATKEEWKMQAETAKILCPHIGISATCVRVPVRVGHAIAAHVEFQEELSVDTALSVLHQAPGISVHSSPDQYTTPLEAEGSDSVFVSRVRKDPTVPHGLQLWIVADNLRKGAALNAIQIAEFMTRSSS